MVAKTQSEIVNDALSIVGIKAADEGAAAADYAIAARMLDRMVKTWQTVGFHLWTRQTGYLFFQPGQAQYTIPGTDKATETFLETTTTAAAVTGAGSVVVTNSTGMAVNDNIGIKQDDGTILWATINTITPTVAPAATIALSSTLTDDAAAGAAVYTYTIDLGKMLRMPDANRVQGTGTAKQEIPMVQMGRIDYRNLPNKATSGTPVQFYYDPDKADGQVSVWPVPSATDTYMSFTYYRELEGFEAANTVADFPNEWEEALVYNLAVRVASSAGLNVKPEVAAIARSSYSAATSFDQGDASLVLQYAPYGRQ